MKWVVLVCRLILAAVFLAAAIPKIVWPHDFALAVFRYRILPYPLVNLAALVLPWVELVSALALLAAPRLRNAAALLIAGMLAIFTSAIAFNLFRGINIACGCFSVAEDASEMSGLNLVRNAALIACALIVLLSTRGHIPARRE